MIDASWYQQPPEVPQSLSAGGVVIHLSDDQVWIALVREAEFDAYILPKGSVEPGEDLETTARREIEEEAGLSDLVLLDKLGVSERLNYSRKSWKVIHYFLFLSRSLVGKPTDLHHHYVCEWFPIDQLPDFFWPEQKALVVDHYQRILRFAKTKGQDRPVS